MQPIHFSDKYSLCSNRFEWEGFRSRISIIDIALSTGYAIQKQKGLKWPVLKNDATGDKIIIVNAKSVSNQGYFNPENDKDKGTLIHFVRNRLGGIFQYDGSISVMANVHRVLSGFLHFPACELKENIRAEKQSILNNIQKDFILPELIRTKNIRYLEQRGIGKATYNNLLFKNRIFIRKVGNFQNVCFPYYDVSGKIIALEERNKNWKHFVAGSEKRNAVWHSGIPESCNAAVLTESPIDALSYHRLKGKGNTMYVAFGGAVSFNQIKTLRAIIEKTDRTDLKMICALDNDDAGCRYAKLIGENFENVEMDLPIKKDWNEELLIN